MAKKNQIQVVEARQVLPSIDRRQFLINRGQLNQLLEKAGIPDNLSNKDAILATCKAIKAEIACKSDDQLTIADAIAVRAADMAEIAPTASKEVEAIVRQMGMIE